MNVKEVIKSKLDILADYQSEKDVINLQKQELIDSILTPEIKAQIADIEAEFSGKSETVDENIETITSEIKQAIIDTGESVKGDYLHAIWVKGRVSWDTKSLDGYAVAHPELLELRKQGDPSVSIRKI